MERKVEIIELEKEFLLCSEIRRRRRRRSGLLGMEGVLLGESRWCGNVN